MIFALNSVFLNILKQCFKRVQSTITQQVHIPWPVSWPYLDLYLGMLISCKQTAFAIIQPHLVDKFEMKHFLHQHNQQKYFIFNFQKVEKIEGSLLTKP